MKKVLAVTLLTSFIVGCSATNSLPLPQKDRAYSQYIETESLASTSKVNNFRYSSWQSLSDKYLILNTADNDAYLVKTQGVCKGLSDAITIKLNRTASSAIYTFNDSITHDRAKNKRCVIQSIYPVTTEQSDHIVNVLSVEESQS